MSAGWRVVYVRFLIRCIDGQAWAGWYVGMAYTLVHLGRCTTYLLRVRASWCVAVPYVGDHDGYEEEPNQVEDDEVTNRASPPHTYTYVYKRRAHTGHSVSGWTGGNNGEG